MRKKRRNVWRGLVGGLAGGAAGSFVMGQFHTLGAKWIEQNAKGQDEDSTVKAATAISQVVRHRPLVPEEKKPASYLVHYAFGTTLGGLYGAAAERKPAVASAAGAPFGAAVWLGAHEIAVPALKLAKPPTQEPLAMQGLELAAHFVYGVTTEAVRRLVRKVL